MTKRDSIAVNILGRKVGEAMNNVPMVKHVSFFESVKIRDRVAPIQKMVSVPILDSGQPVGVAQFHSEFVGILVAIRESVPVEQRVGITEREPQRRGTNDHGQRTVLHTGRTRRSSR